MATALAGSPSPVSAVHASSRRSNAVICVINTTSKAVASWISWVLVGVHAAVSFKKKRKRCLGQLAWTQTLVCNIRLPMAWHTHRKVPEVQHDEKRLYGLFALLCPAYVMFWTKAWKAISCCSIWRPQKRALIFKTSRLLAILAVYAVVAMLLCTYLQPLQRHRVGVN